MAGAVDAGMDGDQGALADAAANLLWAQPRVEELLAADDPMRRAGDLGDDLIGCPG